MSIKRYPQPRKLNRHSYIMTNYSDQKITFRVVNPKMELELPIRNTHIVIINRFFNQLKQ